MASSSSSSSAAVREFDDSDFVNDSHVDVYRRPTIPETVVKQEEIQKYDVIEDEEAENTSHTDASAVFDVLKYENCQPGNIITFKRENNTAGYARVYSMSTSTDLEDSANTRPPPETVYLTIAPLYLDTSINEKAAVKVFVEEPTQKKSKKDDVLRGQRVPINTYFECAEVQPKTIRYTCVLNPKVVSYEVMDAAEEDWGKAVEKTYHPRMSTIQKRPIIIGHVGIESEEFNALVNCDNEHLQEIIKHLNHMWERCKKRTVTRHDKTYHMVQTIVPRDWKIFWYHFSPESITKLNALHFDCVPFKVLEEVKKIVFNPFVIGGRITRNVGNAHGNLWTCMLLQEDEFIDRALISEKLIDGSSDFVYGKICGIVEARARSFPGDVVMNYLFKRVPDLIKGLMRALKKQQRNVDLVKEKNGRVVPIREKDEEDDDGSEEDDGWVVPDDSDNEHGKRTKKHKVSSKESLKKKRKEKKKHRRDSSDSDDNDDSFSELSSLDQSLSDGSHSSSEDDDSSDDDILDDDDSEKQNSKKRPQKKTTAKTKQPKTPVSNKATQKMKLSKLFADSSEEDDNEVDEISDS